MNIHEGKADAISTTISRAGSYSTRRSCDSYKTALQGLGTN